LVVLLVDGKPVLGIIVEVQLDYDDDKRYSWPVYVAGLRAVSSANAATGGDTQFNYCPLGLKASRPGTWRPLAPLCSGRRVFPSSPTRDSQAARYSAGTISAKIGRFDLDLAIARQLDMKCFVEQERSQFWTIAKEPDQDFVYCEGTPSQYEEKQDSQEHRIGITQTLTRSGTTHPCPHDASGQNNLVSPEARRARRRSDRARVTGMNNNQEVKSNPGPWQREPDIEETRALLWNTTALASGSQRRKAREGRFGRSHRCVTV